MKLLLLILPCSLFVTHAFAQTTTYTYDRLNRLVKVVTSQYTTTYTYDELGNRTTKRIKVDATPIHTQQADHNYRLHYASDTQSATLLSPATAIGYRLLLLDIAGRVLHDQALTATTTHLPLTPCPSGLYLVQILSGTKQHYMQKFLKP